MKQIQSKDINFLATRVRAAGQLARESFSTRLRPKEKREGDLVTRVDVQVQRKLMAAIRQIDSNATILAEEGVAGASRQDLSQSDSAWIVDPIDGTTNLVHGVPHFAIALALVRGGQTELSIVYNPMTRELFTARKGRGAKLNRRSMSVSNTHRLGEALVGFGFPYEAQRSGQIMSAIRSVFSKARDLRRSGSAILDMAYVAAGRLDAYFELGLQPWDIAPGILLVTEAGGKVSDWNGEPVDVECSQNVVASNLKLHADTISAIAGHFH